MAAASVTSLEEIIATVKKKLTANRETILSSCHPWTPWALVELLDIPDFENFPAELILYKAFVTTRRRGIDISNDDGIQYKFKEVTKNGDIFFRSRDEVYPSKCRQYVMEHKGSRGKVTAAQMWHFAVESIQPNHLGILACFLKSRKVSVRMAKMCRQIRRNHAYMLVDVPGKAFVCCIRGPWLHYYT